MLAVSGVGERSSVFDSPEPWIAAIQSGDWKTEGREKQLEFGLTAIEPRYASQVLAASLKTRNHVLACMRVGADIITLPEALFFEMYQHPLTAQGLEEFDKAWEKVKL